MGIRGGHDETTVMLHLRPDLARMGRAVCRVPEGLTAQAHVCFGGLTTFGWLSNDFGPGGHIGDPTGAVSAQRLSRLVLTESRVAVGCPVGVGEVSGSFLGWVGWWRFGGRRVLGVASWGRGC